MDLSKTTDEILDDMCRVVYEKLYGTGVRGLEPYLTALSEELDERKIQHVVSKKCLDKHREKYFKIDLLIPPMERFMMLKNRKHVTRADMNQFRQQESSVGVKGLLVNFYNGVDVRESTSLLPGEEKREVAKQNPRLRNQLNGPRSSSVGKLPGIASDRRRGSRSWGGSSNAVSTAGPAINPATPATANIDFTRIFAAACASFFISEGDRSTFASAFNDFLTQMSIKRLTFPRKHLNGDLLQKPEGVLNENLEYFFKTSSIASQVRKKTPDDNDDEENSNQSIPSTPENQRSAIGSSRYRKLPAIGSSSASSSPKQRRRPTMNRKTTSTLPYLNKPPPFIDVGRGFAAACAAFFLTNGSQEQFYEVFADFLRAITAPSQFGVRYTATLNARRSNDVHENVDSLKLPPKRIINNLRTVLIGDEEEETTKPLSNFTEPPHVPISVDGD
ncbi:hypothetical protein FHG87_018123 [Trinorchestia longiramus]|nr:hypothetical protein FHG87_018123 [Trinorchestia longiramus]